MCYISIGSKMPLPFHLPQRWALYTLGFFIICLLMLTAVGERSVLHLWRLWGEKAKLDEENYRLQNENEGLRQRISKLRNDNFYLEKMAREELNLVRPGEIIYRFPPAEPKKNRGGAVSGPAQPRPSRAQKQPG
ncbi:MAG TPA: septum formation initiator family protein [Candidatus Binatia bacterium]|jgi:cell division protein FtsB